MDQDSIPNKAVPVQQTSPEEDATLLAIEALEAQNVDLDPAPLIRPIPEVTPKVNVPTPQPVIETPEPVPTAAPIAGPLTPAQEIAEALASNEPAPKRFQFFVNQKPPRWPFVIGGVAAVAIGLGVAAYFSFA